MKKLLLILLTIVLVLAYVMSAIAEKPKITGDQVKAALMNDIAFNLVVDDFGQSLFLEEVKAMPDLYYKNNLVEKPFTIKNYLNAQILFWENALATGIAKKLAKCTPKNIIAGYAFIVNNFKSYADYLEWGYRINIRSLKRALKDESNNKIDKSIGLNDINTAKYHDDKLTMREVLITQPLVFIVKHRIDTGSKASPKI